MCIQCVLYSSVITVSAECEDGTSNGQLSLTFNPPACGSIDEPRREKHKSKIQIKSILWIYNDLFTCNSWICRLVEGFVEELHNDVALWLSEIDSFNVSQCTRSKLKHLAF